MMAKRQKTHLQRTTEALRGQDLKYWKVEYRNTWAGITVDLFNIIDLLVLDGGFLGIQVCGTDWMQHVQKLTVDHQENTVDWLKSGGRIELWGWRKVKKKRGGKIMIWRPRIADILLVGGSLFVEERKDVA